MTEAEFNRLAARAITASRWCSKPSPTSTRRCRSISSSPTSPIPICSNRWSAASASAAIRSSASPHARASKCAAMTAPSLRRASRRSSEPRCADPLRVHRRLSRALQGGRAMPGLPRFCGGLVGYFGYDTVRYIEKRLGRARTSPIRWARRTSCCWCPRRWPSSTTCRASCSWSSMPNPASPAPIARRAARLRELLKQLRAPVPFPPTRRRRRSRRCPVSAKRAYHAGGRARQALHLRRRHHAGGAVAAHEPSRFRRRRWRCTARCAR